jgi:Mrp family chromosome partitioning ATPase
VLFDAPPLVSVTDAAILAPQLDGVLLVLAAGRSRRDHTARAREILDKVGARLLGVVLTGVAAETATYGSDEAGRP